MAFAVHGTAELAFTGPTAGSQLIVLLVIGLVVVAVMATWYRPLSFTSSRGSPARCYATAADSTVWPGFTGGWSRVGRRWPRPTPSRRDGAGQGPSGTASSRGRAPQRHLPRWSGRQPAR